MAGGGAAINSVTFNPLKTTFTVNPSRYEDAGSITISCSGAPDSGVYVGSISSSDTSIAEATLNKLSGTVSGNNVTTDFMVKPNSAGTVTLTATAFDNVNLRNVTGTLKITVTPTEDESYLNKRGLAHFWENIDTLKQDKLTAGNYSTSEQDTKFTWTNGAKIYKKTIVSTNLVAGENNINHGISNLGLVLKYDGFMDIGSGTTLPIPTMASATNNSVSIWIVNSTIIRIFSSLAFTGKVYITLYYTKTS